MRPARRRLQNIAIKVKTHTIMVNAYNYNLGSDMPEIKNKTPR